MHFHFIISSKQDIDNIHLCQEISFPIYWQKTCVMHWEPDLWYEDACDISHKLKWCANKHPQRAKNANWDCNMTQKDFLVKNNLSTKCSFKTWHKSVPVKLVSPTSAFSTIVAAAAALPAFLIHCLLWRTTIPARLSQRFIFPSDKYLVTKIRKILSVKTDSFTSTSFKESRADFALHCQYLCLSFPHKLYFLLLFL